MIDLFENTVRTNPNKVFATFVNDAGAEASYTYRQVRLAAAAVARRLQVSGVNPGDSVVVDLSNSLEFLLLVLASAYGSFTLVILNHRLSNAEKLTRLHELEREGLRVSCTIDKAYAKRLMGRMRTRLCDDNDEFLEVMYQDMPHSRVIMGEHQDVVDDTVHFAERQAHLFDDDKRAVVMFTSGTTGKPKAVPFTWRQLIAAARAANEASMTPGKGLWQAVLPFCHIGGFQVLVRSVVNETPLLAYSHFDAERVLRDAGVHHVTHISVVDKMLQDMLTVNEREGDQPGRLGVYRCILLGGGVLNPQTVKRTLRAGVHAYASYGMTETSSQIANAPITSDFTGGLKLLEGYEARIVDPAEDGFGRLAVSGPGVFKGYLNAKAAFTVDGFFLTGDTAALRDGLLFVRERTSDMFVSGGENIYPAEVAYAIRQVPGVEDAHVFGVPDKKWGRRPVAVVERSHASLRAYEVRRAMEGRLSKLSMPEKILMVDELPRKSIGKVDREAAEAFYENRLEVSKIVLHYIRLPFREPFKTAQATLTHRNLVVVEAVDHKGRVGLGECVSFDDDWYLPETLGDDMHLIRNVLAPALLGQSFLHPRDVSAELAATMPGLGTYPLAQSALEMAFWDLYGHIHQRPLWMLVNDEYERLWSIASLRDAGVPARSKLPRTASIQGTQALVLAGAVIGIGTPEETVQTVRDAVEAGYRRVKLKIAPHDGLETVRAVREAFPELLITLDANRSFSEDEVDELRAFDEFGVGWIEEPLVAKSRTGFGNSNEQLTHLSRLQHKLATPICVDESFVNAVEADQVLKFPDLRCIAVKMAKIGGIEGALRFIVKAQRQGREIWMGGMYDTGISRRVYAAFETLPGIVIPGDIGATSRYFTTDVTEPAYTVTRGCVLLNGQGCTTGIGCKLNEDALSDVLVEREVIE